IHAVCAKCVLQRRAARFICNDFRRESSVSEMLRELKLNTLHKRRLNLKLSLFYKIDAKLTPMDIPPMLIRKIVNGRTDNGKSYKHIASHSNPFFSSFYPKTVRDWNNLQNNVVSAPSLESFNERINMLCD